MDTAIANDSGAYEISWISDNYLKFIIKKSPVKNISNNNNNDTTTTTTPQSPKHSKKTSPHKRERLQLDNIADDDQLSKMDDDCDCHNNKPIKLNFNSNESTTTPTNTNTNTTDVSLLAVPELTLKDFNTKKKQKKQPTQQQQDVDFKETKDSDNENNIEKQEIEIKSMDKLVLNPTPPTTTTTTTTTSTTTTNNSEKEKEGEDEDIDVVDDGEKKNKGEEEKEEDINYNGNTVLGTRDENQDSFFHKNLKDHNTRIIGVFDGHGDQGKDAAITTRDIVSNCLEEAIKMNGNDNNVDIDKTEFYDNCIINSFSNANKVLLEKGKVSGDWGTTATLAIINDNKIRCGWVGDSMAVLFRLSTTGREYQPTQLTNDHKPENSSEKKRIISTGGRVVYRCGCWRVIPNRLDYTNDEIMKQRLALNMSRALGHIVLSKYGVSSEPDFQGETLNPGDFVILASDGLWNVLDLKTICKYIKKCSSTKELTDLLLSTVESKCTNFKIPCDNVTICCYRHS